MRVLLVLVCLTVASVAQAQTYRAVPGNDAAPFVEQVDPGALCPSCQVIVLVDAYPPPDYVNVYGPRVPIARKPTADVLVYDSATGATLLVITSPFGAMTPYPAMGMYERCQWVQLRPGVVWATGDLDGDGRADLLGHDKRTGDVVRMYRRGWE